MLLAWNHTIKLSEQILFLLIVTHDTDFTIKTDRIIEIAEGKTLNQMTKGLVFNQIKE